MTDDEVWYKAYAVPVIAVTPMLAYRWGTAKRQQDCGDARGESDDANVQCEECNATFSEATACTTRDEKDRCFKDEEYRVDCEYSRVF